MKIRFIKPTAIFAAILVTIGFCHSEALDPNSFTRRMPITFSGYSGEASLTNFPVLVKFSEGITEFSYDDFSAGGTNLRFSDINGQSLDYEIDTWNSNGTSTVWVRVPELTDETKIYAYWGANFTEHAASHGNGAVWAPSSHAGVWHFSSIVDGVTQDSTANKLNATANLPNVSTGRVDGIIGNCAFNSDSSAGQDGSGFLTQNYNSLALGSTFTLSGWCRHRSAVPTYDRVFSRKMSYSANDGFETQLNSGTSTKMTARGSGSSGVTVTTPNITLGQWYHLTFVYDGATLRSYVNGVAGATGTIGAATDNGLGLAFGNNVAKNEHTYKGSFDEFRLRDGLSSPQWIATEYANVTDPNFASFGMVETLNADIPQIMPSKIVSVDFHSADVEWTLSRVGTSSPAISFVYGTDPAQMNTTSLIVSAVSAPTTQTNTLSGLLCYNTYYVSIIAINDSGSSESPVLMFRTPGEPILGTPSIEATGTTLVISGELIDIGVSNATVELWFGTDPDALYKIKEWSNLSSGQTFSETHVNQPFDTYYCRFRAYNECMGVTNEVSTAMVNTTVYGDVVWTGNANDLYWNNPQNWNPTVVPSEMDTAVFTDSGLSAGSTIKLGANQHVKQVSIQTATVFNIGHADDVTAGYSLTLTDLVRDSAPGDIQEFRAPVKLAPDADGKATWTISDGATIRMNAVLDSTAPVTFVKMGAGTFNTYFQSPIYKGPWNIVEGTVTASSGTGRNNTMKGNATVGGTAVPALLANSDQGIYEDANITVLTNGTFTSPGINSGRVRSVHVKEGGVATVNGSYFYCYLANLTGGTINGSGRFWNGGFTQGIRSYSSPNTAYYNIGMTFSSYYEAYIVSEDGPPAIDLDMTLGYLEGNAKELRRQGAGTVVFGKASTHYNTDGVTALGYRMDGGRTIFNNPNGSGCGKNRMQVNGGATIGGTGFLGGDSAHTNFSILVQGGSTTSLASVEPGSVDRDSGVSLPGTLTVGSPTATNNVTFGNHSRLNMQIGKGGEADALVIHGALNLASTSDGLSLQLDPEAKGGTYVLVEATDGITGTFNVLPADFPRVSNLKYTETTVSYVLPPMSTILMLR